MKKLLFWTAVIVGILAAVAVIMNRRSGGDEDSWQGYLEDSKGFVTKAVDAAAEGTKDVVDLTADTSKDVAEKAKRATFVAATSPVRRPPARCGPPPPRWGDRSSHSIAASGG